jgi:hypothetical protein
MEGKLGGIIIAILIGGGVFWMRTNDKNENKQELREVAYSVLERSPDFSEHETDYEYYFEMYHDDVFEDHYKLGSKRVAPSFDEDGYWTEMFSSMITSAEADGEDEVVEGLELLRGTMFGLDD